MKMKFFKPMAVTLTVMVGSLISSSALAAQVVTTTTYTHGAGAGSVSVETNVSSLDPEIQVTYFVSKGDAADPSIIYIDQAKATAAGTAAFTFNATQGTLFDESLTATAKFGSNNGTEFPTFSFTEGTNRLSNGTATVTNSAIDLGDAFGAVANVSGNVTEYGFELFKGDVNKGDLRAYGSYVDGDASTYAVIVDGISAADGYSLKAYAVKPDGTKVYAE